MARAAQTASPAAATTEVAPAAAAPVAQAAPGGTLLPRYPESVGGSVWKGGAVWDPYALSSSLDTAPYYSSPGTFDTLGMPSLATYYAEWGLWGPYIELAGRGSSIRVFGQGNLFLPLLQDSDKLLFADLRGLWTDGDAAEGNFGLAYRTILPSDWIVGAHLFYDLRGSELGNVYHQATAGIELLNEYWGFRANGYVPDQAPKLVPGLQGAFLQGGTIVVRAGVEVPYWGMDFEVERLLWYGVGRRCNGCGPSGLGALDAELWAAVGMFHFDSSVIPSQAMTGPRVRAELRLFDLPMLGSGSRLVLSAQYQYDGVRDHVGSAMLAVRIPFGGGGCRRGCHLTGLARRMVTPIVRDVDIVTNIGLGRAEPAKVARTGLVISRALTVDGNTADAEGAIEGAGANSVVIADGSAGTISPADTIDVNDGQVLMGGGSSLAVIGCNTGTRATFTAPGTRATINSGANVAVHAADNASVQSVDLVTTGDGAHAVLLNNDSNVLIEDVNITTFGDVAVGIWSEDTSQFTVDNSTFTTSGDGAHGILSFGDSQFTVDNSTITTSGDWAAGILSYDNSQFILDNSTFTTSGDGAYGILSFDNSQFILNNSTITTSGDFAQAILSYDNSQFTLNNSTITTSGVLAQAIRSYQNSQFTLNNSTITTSGDFAAGIWSEEDSQFTLNNSTIASSGGTAYGIVSFDNSQFTVNNSTIASSGGIACGILSIDNSQFTLNNSTITTFGDLALGISSGGNSQFTVNGGTITSTGAGAAGVYAYTSSPANTILLLDGVTINSAGNGVLLVASGTINATISGSTITAGGGFDEIHAATFGAGTGTINLSAFENLLNGGAGTIRLDRTPAGSAINVTQGAPGSGAGGIDTLNGIPAGNVFTPLFPAVFNAPAPPTP